MNRFRIASAFALLLTALALAGCGAKSEPTPPAGSGTEAPAPREVDEVAVERAKLSPEDRALVEAQEWCVISSDERLGSMGVPIKLDIKGEAVFICCKGCKRKAEAEPDATLAKVKDLKAKAKAQHDAKN
jgi:hypothetical protein